MPIPDYQNLMLPVLKVAAEGEQRVAAVVDRIADQLGISEEERNALLPSGRQRVLHNRIHWAKFYLTKAGLIAAPQRGRFVVTEAGKELLATKPERIDVALLLKQPTFREFYKNERGAEADPSSSIRTNGFANLRRTTPQEQIERAHEALQASLRADLLDRTNKNSPDFFERLILDLLISMGYGGSYKTAATQLGRSATAALMA